MENKNKKCNQGWRNGECCCNCKNQIELYKHPMNKKFKGRITESTGMYACLVQWDIDRENKGVLFEKQHGFCEMYQPK
jgi:hypothetical protein